MRIHHALLLIAQFVSADGADPKGPKPGVWVDPSTGLMWNASDNGKDISWRGAMRYCQSLRLDGRSDWRLASLSELQGIFDDNVEALGIAGSARHIRSVTWHVKGNLFLTGRQWISRPVIGRLPNGTYEKHFNFNSGEVDQDPSGWPYPHSGMRALCVRGPDR